jgi:protein farnesyltransferase/geranylgeranyltransferase type-1 subunit alpha
MLAEDAKNYHIWSYRQWLVRHFALWPAGTDTADTSTELGFVEDLLRADVRNNSAWNHRFYVIFGRDDGAAAPVPEAIWAREIAFAKAKIADAPQNQSAWNYLKGVLRRRGRGLDELEEFAGGFASLEAPDAVRSSHALDALAEIWAGRKERERAERALGLLAERYDPVRKNYWDYRRSLLGVDAEA